MMPANENSLEQRALRILSSRPNLTAAKLQEAASTGGKSFSTAAVYKVLTKLQEAGVVIKVGTRYSLSLAWIFEMFTFSHTLTKTYFSHEHLSSLIPASGKKLTWKFSDLIRCNEFWNQLLLALLKHTPAVDCFSWVPYPWFVLLQETRESRLQKAFKMSGRTFYTSFGAGDAFEQKVKDLYTQRNQVVSFAKGPLQHLENSYIDVVGDYVLTVTVDADTAHEVGRLFSAGRKKRENSPSSHLSLLTKKVKVAVTIECNTTKAARLRGSLADFFGIRKDG